MRFKRGDAAPKEPKPKKSIDLKGLLLAIPRGLWSALKSLKPEQEWISDGPWCSCCGSKDHKAKECPKDHIGFYKPNQKPAKVKKEKKSRKGKGGEQATEDTPIAA